FRPGLAPRATLGKWERAKAGKADEATAVVALTVLTAVELLEGRLDLGNLAAPPIQKSASDLVIQRFGGAGGVLGRLAAVPVLVPGGQRADGRGKFGVPGPKELRGLTGGPEIQLGLEFHSPPLSGVLIGGAQTMPREASGQGSRHRSRSHPLEGVGIGVFPDRAFEQISLETEADPVRGLIALPPPPARPRRIQRRQERGADPSWSRRAP